eukprot:6985480-Prymnesium_polylepis.1
MLWLPEKYEVLNHAPTGQEIVLSKKVLAKEEPPPELEEWARSVAREHAKVRDRGDLRLWRAHERSR